MLLTLNVTVVNILGMTAPQEYVNALDKAIVDLEGRVQKRDILNAEIAGLRETVKVLATLVGLPADKSKRVAQLLATVDSATPSLTDAVRSLLTRVHPKEMTATEVRNALEESSFNFGDFSNPLSACHSALKRLLNDDQIEAGSPQDGKTTYKAKLPAFSALATLLSSPITEDGAFYRHLASLAGVAQPTVALDKDAALADHPMNKLRARPRQK